MTQGMNGVALVDCADQAWDKMTTWITRQDITDDDKALILRLLEKSCGVLAQSYEDWAIPELAAGEEVKLSPGVTMILTVTRDGVTEIRLLPDQTGTPLFVDLVRGGQVVEEELNEDTERNERKVEAARDYVQSHIWKPLLDLPPSIVWEG